MRLRGYFWLPVALSSALFFPSSAAADVIQITSGFVEMGSGFDPFDLVGDRRGFRLFGREYNGGVAVNAFVFCEGDVCDPGDEAEIRHAAGGLDLPAHATLDGVFYEDVGNLSGPAFAEIGFSGTVVLPPEASSAVLRTPFTMQGSFSVDGGAGSPHTLVGSGIVTSSWTAGTDESGLPIWDLLSLRYEFGGTASPVPEPTTLALFGAAGAVVAYRRRSARRVP